MGDISEHFSRSEFACKCGCGLNVVDAELLVVEEDLRLYFNASVELHDACRCPTHNAAVGGVPHSQHLLGKAADTAVMGQSPDNVANYLLNKYPNKYGIGRYDTFTHIDVRSTKSRWDFRSQVVHENGD